MYCLIWLLGLVNIFTIIESVCLIAPKEDANKNLSSSLNSSNNMSTSSNEFTLNLVANSIDPLEMNTAANTVI